MYLKELTLHNFRNYARLNLTFESDMILLVGQNAQGKTNILESIVYTCTGRSHRTSRDREVIRWGEDFAYIKAVVEKRIGKNIIEIGLDTNRKKMININGTSAKRLGELMGNINGVLFSPEDLRLIKDGPAERRRFLDMEISQIMPKYFYRLQQYNRVLAQRNDLLKDINRQPSLIKSLDVWNEQLALSGAYIIFKRNEFIEELMKISREIHSSITFGKEILDIIYKPSIPHEGGVDEIAKNFLEILKSSEQKDIDRGITSKGCHRDDIIFMINNTDTRIYGSQGQQRTVVLSLKLSEIEIMERLTGEAPILLLDDVMSELDEHRQKMLLDSIGKVQTIITTTDIRDVSMMDGKQYEVYRVDNGNVWRQL